MGKMFVHYLGTVEQFKLLSNLSDYANKIVFIKGGADGKGAAIYTHGEYYANAKDLADLKFISSVKAGGVTATAQGHNGVIEFSSDDDTTVSVVADSTGIKIGLAQTFVKQVDDATAAIALEVKDREAAVNTINGELAKKALATDLTGVSNRVKAIEDDYLTSENETSIKNAVIGASGDASTADTIYGAKKYAEEKANAAKSGAEATASADATAKANQALADAKTYVGEEIAKLDANVTSAETGKVKVQVIEVDGKITEVHVTESDIASAEVLAAVKSDVDYFLGSALNKDNAEAVKDTLKEIQDYIDSDVQGAAGMTASIKEAKDAADAAQAAANKAQGEVDALEGVVEGVKATADAAATQAALTEEINRAKKAEGDNAAAIKAIADDYLVGQDRTDLEEMINGKVAQSAYDAKMSALEKADTDNLAAAKEYADGLVNALDVTDAAVTGQYVSAVGQADGKISVTRANLPTYTLTTGSANGTVALNGVDAAVKGLGSAAYTEASAYATAAQGAKADAAAPQATTYTKEEVDAFWAWEEL